MVGIHGFLWFLVGFSWFLVGFHGSRSVFIVFHGSRLVFHGSGWVFMVFNGSKLVFHDSRLVFMVFHCSSSVFMVFHGSWLIFHSCGFWCSLWLWESWSGAGRALRWRLGATRSQSVTQEPLNSEHWISIIWNSGTDTTRLLEVGLVSPRFLWMVFSVPVC